MLLRTTLKYLPAQVLAPLAQLASMIAWTHWLAPEQMGAFTLVATTQELAGLACFFWFSTYTLRTLPGGDADPAARQRYLQTENAVMLGGCLALAALGVVCSVSVPGAAPLTQTAPAIVLFFVTRALNTHYAERARAQADTTAYTLLQSIGPIGGLAVGWLALRFMPPSAHVLWFSYAAAQAVAVGVALPRLGMAWQWRRPDRDVLRAASRLGGPMLALSALGWVAENHLRYLVEWQSGAVALGLMAVGWGLGRRCASVASMLVMAAAFPLASKLLNEGRRDEAVAQLGLSAALLLAVSLPVCVGTYFLGPAIVQLAVAPAYREVTSAVLTWSVVAGVVRCLHVHLSDQWLILERRFALAAWIDGVEIAACGGASIAGLALYGLSGAVAGQLIGSALALALSLHWARTRLGMHWPWRDVATIVCAAAAMTGVFALLPAPRTAADLIVQGVSATLAYLAALTLLHLSLARLPRPLRSVR